MQRPSSHCGRVLAAGTRIYLKARPAADPQKAAWQARYGMRHASSSFKGLCSISGVAFAWSLAVWLIDVNAGPL
jgi:hypothetical protein